MRWPTVRLRRSISDADRGWLGSRRTHSLTQVASHRVPRSRTRDGYLYPVPAFDLPVSLALCQSVDRVRGGSGVSLEPKFDGWRCQVLAGTAPI